MMPTTSEEKYKNRYRIPSARASWHDYLDGAYFVTICTKNRELYLGNIADGELTLSEIGRYAEEQFREVSSLYPVLPHLQCGSREYQHLQCEKQRCAAAVDLFRIPLQLAYFGQNSAP